MKNLLAIFSVIAIFALSGAVIASLPSEGALGLFAIGILVAIIELLVSMWAIKLIAKNPQGVFLFFTLMLTLLSVFFIINISDLIAVLDVVSGWCCGLVFGTGVLIYNCYLILTNRI